MSAREGTGSDLLENEKVVAKGGQKVAGQARSDAMSAKTRQIVAGARSAFHELGYEGTSVDEIARRAGVSKPTLYNHFADKEALYAATFTMECQEQARRLFEPNEVGAGDCLETTLADLARVFVTFLVSDFVQSNFRNAVAEAARFPALGRAYYESGQDLGKERVAALLRCAVKSGRLRIDDVDLAAHQFLALCHADLFHKRLFFVSEKISKAEINRVADSAASMFLRAYGAPAAGPSC